MATFIIITGVLNTITILAAYNVITEINEKLDNKSGDMFKAILDKAAEEALKDIDNTDFDNWFS